ncbi:hypothetical protein CEXT_742411 [Caerostris extrusa]|uniref:Uncharacterized protein n=1 Tax=Caerostris extrusa TaxID=172846 RepID=A0AAV4Y068_CAEEX|nr:hypothetical protein CEXT_742411 [Caerostris extrusa]
MTSPPFLIILCHMVENLYDVHRDHRLSPASRMVTLVTPHIIYYKMTSTAICRKIKLTWNARSPTVGLITTLPHSYFHQSFHENRMLPNQLRILSFSSEGEKMVEWNKKNKKNERGKTERGMYATVVDVGLILGERGDQGLRQQRPLTVTAGS